MAFHGNYDALYQVRPSAFPAAACICGTRLWALLAAEDLVRLGMDGKRIRVICPDAEFALPLDLLEKHQQASFDLLQSLPAAEGATVLERIHRMNGKQEEAALSYGLSMDAVGQIVRLFSARGDAVKGKPVRNYYDKVIGSPYWRKRASQFGLTPQTDAGRVREYLHRYLSPERYLLADPDGLQKLVLDPLLSYLRQSGVKVETRKSVQRREDVLVLCGEESIFLQEGDAVLAEEDAAFLDGEQLDPEGTIEREAQTAMLLVNGALGLDRQVPLRWNGADDIRELLRSLGALLEGRKLQDLPLGWAEKIGIKAGLSWIGGTSLEKALREAGLI